jgi:hypothetical protein
VIAGLTATATVTHTLVAHNVLSDSTIDGLLVGTGDVPGSVLAHTRLRQNQVKNNARYGINVIANLLGAGSGTTIEYTTIADNDVTGNGVIGVLLVSAGDRNVFSKTTVARNTITGNTFFGIDVLGGSTGADESNVDLRIQDNTVTDNGLIGIQVIAGLDNSSHNHLTAQIHGNTVARHFFFGIVTAAGVGADTLPTGSSNHNVLEVTTKRNTVKE